MKELFNILTVAFVLLFSLCYASIDDGSEEHQKKIWEQHNDNVQKFRYDFQNMRFEHFENVKHLAIMHNSDRKRKVMVKEFIRIMMDEVHAAKIFLERAQYVPGMIFPSENAHNAAITSALETAALFTELTLWLPADVKPVWRENNTIQVLMKWCIGFSNATGIYPDDYVPMMHAIGQELDLVKYKDPDYKNPYYNRRMPGLGLFEDNEDVFFTDVRRVPPDEMRRDAEKKWGIKPQLSGIVNTRREGL